jgi:short-subunit dehydrogenase
LSLSPAVRLKPLREQVIVITGASSGIGRATARMAARRGAHVVCAARNAEALNALVEEIELGGGRALAIACDVTEVAAVRALGERAVAWAGRIDCWVNNAGVSIASALRDLPEAEARRLFDVNFWGVVTGSQTALPYLERQGGALINMGSFVSDVAAPFMGMYAASKHAIKGYTDALRIELRMDKRKVSVTLIKPSPIATPVLQHQRNRLGRQATMPPPFYRPEDVAAAILYAAEHPARDLFVGGAARIGSVLGQALPALTDLITARSARRLFMNARPSQDRPDNLFAPSIPAAIDGETRGRKARRSVYTALRLRPRLAASLTMAGLGLVLARYVLRGR